MLFRSGQYVERPFNLLWWPDITALQRDTVDYVFPLAVYRAQLWIFFTVPQWG